MEHLQSRQLTNNENKGIALCISMSFGNGWLWRLSIPLNIFFFFFFLQISADSRENLLYYDDQDIKKAEAYAK